MLEWKNKFEVRPYGRQTYDMLQFQNVQVTKHLTNKIK